MAYNIIEVANTHSGDRKYLSDLITEFSKYREGFGIKFQPSKPDCIAIPDYEYYEVYKEFFYNEGEWRFFISEAAKTKDVWLDLFDTYSIKILKENESLIRGVKLQASVLNNLEVVNSLKEYGLKGKDLIINIAGYEIPEIQDLLNDFEENINAREIYLEIGFQAYPTRLEDSGYSKISVIKKHFSNRIVFADHIDAKDPMALYFPQMALLQGIDMIEKHVRLDRETKYDHFSSLTPDQYAQFIQLQDDCKELKNQPFINDREREYLSKSLMKPIVDRDIERGSVLNLNKDILFRRSGKEGLDIYQIRDKIDNYQIVSRKIEENSTLTRHDFKTAHIATIVACRLKSTRLKSKALELIGDVTSIEYCLRNCLRFPVVQTTVLATSNLESDLPLKDYTYSPDVHFHQGDPVDVIDRYISVINELKIDVFIRVTGDNPFVDPGICEILLKEHFRNGADYTTAKRTAIGTNLEIINSSALRKVKSFFPNAKHSEYMSKYFTNNPDYFNIHIVDLPEKYIRDYRLTLDYPEDLVLYNEIHNKLVDQKEDFTIEDVFELLDTTNLSEINNHHSQKYTTDQKLIKILNANTTIRE